MEPKEINLEDLESKYFSQLLVDDRIIDGAAVFSTDERYLVENVLESKAAGKALLITVVIILNLIPAKYIAKLVTEISGGERISSAFFYFPLLALWIFLIILISNKMKSKSKEGRLQYFFITKEYFVMNYYGQDFIIPVSYITKVKALKYSGKDKNIGIIRLEARKKLTLYTGAEDAERIHKLLTDICGKR